MSKTVLFTNTDGIGVTDYDMNKKMREVGAHSCKTLFIHSDIMFGKLNSKLKRKEYMELIFQAIMDLNVDTILMPSFTFSFCNKETYDIQSSKTPMGALNEYIRKKDITKRSMDPILSVIGIGKETEMLKNVGHHSLGKDCVYDIIHNSNDVKFLFLGAEIGECFTYLHYVEKMMNVPYRFDMPFDGTIIDESGKSYEDTYYLFAGRKGVKPACSYYFRDYLIEKDFLKSTPFGMKHITCITEEDAYREAVKKINEDVNYLLEEPYTNASMEPIYTKGEDGQKIISC